VPWDGEGGKAGRQAGRQAGKALPQSGWAAGSWLPSDVRPVCFFAFCRIKSESL